MVIKDVKNVDEQNDQQENVDDLIDEINNEDLYNISRWWQSEIRIIALQVWKGNISPSFYELNPKSCTITLYCMDKFRVSKNFGGQPMNSREH